MLADALRSYIERDKWIPFTLVLDAYAEHLTEEVEALVTPRKVKFCDLRNGLWDGFADVIEQGLRQGVVVHVAIDQTFDGRLYEALWNRLPNQWNLAARAADEMDDLWQRSQPDERWDLLDAVAWDGTVVVSTPAARESDIEFLGEIMLEEKPGGLRWLFGFHTVKGSEHRSPWKPRPVTQAIILVHGIGRQRPKHTLRKFVSAVVGGDEPRLTNEQDDSSHPEIRRELRKLVYQATDQTGPRGRRFEAPRNEFFEYYWADAIEGTTPYHVQGWFWRLLKHKPPRHLVPLWAIAWLAIAITLGTLVLGGANLVTRFTTVIPPFVAATASFVGLIVYRHIVLETVGDVTRYLDPDPENISIRKRVRERGITLLRNLIASGEYDRIVIVGHSLGSAVAYDVLRVLWDEDMKPLRKELFPSSGDPLPDFKLTCGSEAEVIAFQEWQLSLLSRLKEEGLTGWPITDFITIGSPLAHAALLLPGELQKRQAELELPTCPPQPDKRSREWPVRRPNSVSIHFNPAALFGLTRWTNIYAPARFGLFGDPIAGPLKPWFGLGIRDRPVSTGGILRSSTPIAHISYWRTARNSSRTELPGDVELNSFASDSGPTPNGMNSKVTARIKRWLRWRWSAVSDPEDSLEAVIHALDLQAERLGIPGRKPNGMVPKGGL